MALIEPSFLSTPSDLKEEMPNGTNSEDHLSNGWKGDETDVQITASRYKHNGGWVGVVIR